MAAGRLPEPGTEYGPCLGCRHTDCAATRAMAETVCTYCGESIGYNRGFFRVGDDDRLAHESCVYDREET